MCKCIDEIENKMKVKYQEEHKNEEITDCYFENKWISFEEKCETIELSLPLTIEYTVKTSKGKVLNRKYHCNMTTTYCPICGERIRHQ